MVKHFDRDYVILLPEWVRPETIVINKLLRLEHCRLRCLEWDPNRHASHSRLTYKAWIKLEQLPFECWSEKCVTAMVIGFGRFIRADVNSINLVDLTGFKCLIAVDDLTDIPEHLSISMGDFVVSASVRIESTAPFGGDDRGIPFVEGDVGEGGDQTDPRGRRWPDVLGPPRRAGKTGAPGRAFARATQVHGFLRRSETGGVPCRGAGRRRAGAPVWRGVLPVGFFRIAPHARGTIGARQIAVEAASGSTLSASSGPGVGGCCGWTFEACLFGEQSFVIPLLSACFEGGAASYWGFFLGDAIFEGGRDCTRGDGSHGRGGLCISCS